MLMYMIDSLESVSHVESEAGMAIAHYYQSMKLSRHEAINDFSAIFLGSPYELTALGEGVHGDFDHFPLYRVDAFDCQTFVETVMALSWSQSFEEFHQKKLFVSYSDQSIDYLHRAHFICMDWSHLLNTGRYLLDISKSLADEEGGLSVHASSVVIDRSKWFQEKTFKSARLLDGSSDAAINRQLQALHCHAASIAPQKSDLNCILGKDLFCLPADRRRDLLASIPSGSVMKIICTNNSFCEKSQSGIHVRHLGFVVHYNNGVFFRHASSDQGCVTDDLCEDYLQRFMRRFPKMGIVIYQVLL